MQRLCNFYQINTDIFSDVLKITFFVFLELLMYCFIQIIQIYGTSFLKP